MTTVAQLLAASDTVKAIVGTNPVRVFEWGRAPTAGLSSYILWKVVAEAPAGTFDGSSMDNQRVQVDCYAATAAVCKQLAKATRDAIELDGENVMIGLNSSAQDDATNLFLISRDYSLWVDP